ncbi:uncharacterized protein LOC116307609 [Actinia tenebrosa]|uniref:Uncharacterized protein LOC116307609 n=1 Tax=Actinia tenebrosa TaxID=6105 RepID=A0A6P8J7C6_ACTTE|nr:uncharacterized protein LOC116307609 [Actinia tenebrosa]
MASDLLWLLSSAVVFLSFPSQVVSMTTHGRYALKPNHTVGLTCADSYCSTNCCIDSSTDELICCDEESEDYLWWFWVAVIVFVLVLSMCFGACCCKIHRRRVRRHFLVVTQENPPTITTYGTESIAPVMRGIPPGYHQMPPPEYPQAKLPCYTPVDTNKGNPPPYQ